METNGRRAGIERAGVRSDDPLAQIGNLETLGCEIALDKLSHGPIEKQRPGFFIAAEAFVDLLACRRFADPEIVLIGWAEGIALTCNHVRHGAPAIDILRSEAREFGFAPLVVIVELDARAVFEGDGETVACGRPRISASR